MRQRAWLTAMAGALGVSEAACHRDATDDLAGARDVAPLAVTASASSSAASTATSSAASTAIDVAVATPSASPSTSVARVRSAPSVEPDLSLISASCHAMAQVTQNGCGGLAIATGRGICGATIQRAPPPPAIDIQASVSGGSSGDDRVVATARPRLRACANQALRSNPTLLQGKVVVALAVGATGDVTSSTVAGNTGLSPAAAACMAARMRSLQFPAGSARTLSVAIVQTKNNS